MNSNFKTIEKKVTGDMLCFGSNIREELGQSLSSLIEGKLELAPASDPGADNFTEKIDSEAQLRLDHNYDVIQNSFDHMGHHVNVRGSASMPLRVSSGRSSYCVVTKLGRLVRFDFLKCFFLKK